MGFDRFFDAFFPLYTLGTCAHYWFTYSDSHKRCNRYNPDTFHQFIQTSMRLKALENKLSGDIPHETSNEKISWFRDR